MINRDKFLALCEDPDSEDISRSPEVIAKLYDESLPNVLFDVFLQSLIADLRAGKIYKIANEVTLGECYFLVKKCLNTSGEPQELMINILRLLWHHLPLDDPRAKVIEDRVWGLISNTESPRDVSLYTVGFQQDVNGVLQSIKGKRFFRSTVKLVGSVPFREASLISMGLITTPNTQIKTGSDFELLPEEIKTHIAAGRIPLVSEHGDNGYEATFTDMMTLPPEEAIAETKNKLKNFCIENQIEFFPMLLHTSHYHTDSDTAEGNDQGRTAVYVKAQADGEVVPYPIKTSTGEKALEFKGIGLRHGFNGGLAWRFNGGLSHLGGMNLDQAEREMMHANNDRSHFSVPAITSFGIPPLVKAGYGKSAVALRLTASTERLSYEDRIRENGEKTEICAEKIVRNYAREFIRTICDQKVLINADSFHAENLVVMKKEDEEWRFSDFADRNHLSSSEIPRYMERDLLEDSESCLIAVEINVFNYIVGYRFLPFVDQDQCRDLFISTLKSESLKRGISLEIDSEMNTRELTNVLVSQLVAPILSIERLRNGYVPSHLARVPRFVKTEFKGEVNASSVVNKFFSQLVTITSDNEIPKDVPKDKRLVASTAEEDTVAILRSYKKRYDEGESPEYFLFEEGFANLLVELMKTMDRNSNLLFNLMGLVEHVISPTKHFLENVHLHFSHLAKADWVDDETKKYAQIEADKLPDRFKKCAEVIRNYPENYGSSDFCNDFVAACTIEPNQNISPHF